MSVGWLYTIQQGFNREPEPAPPPTLVVSEVFGPTVQGEGPSTGRRCTFLRLGACNLHCSWCDTAYTWDASRYNLRAELSRRDTAEVVDEILTTGTGLLVVSGGEPLLQQTHAGWSYVLLRMRDAGWEVEVETNGTREPTAQTVDLMTRFNVSPKLAHAGDPESKRIVPDALRVLRDTGKASFKFVAATETDLNEIASVVDAADIPPSMVWVMPEGTTRDKVLAGTVTLADPVINRGWNLTTRLHVLVWGDERGK